ncbi:MAG TPA: hypothetical protein VMS65_13705 [Polyangiaceae bacterium]|nr:hypothetical protein [Polyangiaceae bacterium]
MGRWFARQRRRRTAAVFAFGLTLGRTAGAQVEPIRVEYAAAPDCPSADVFTADVLGRTARARLAEASEANRTFVVSIQRHGARFVGSLVVRGGGGDTTAREVTGEQCSEVASALALATSLAIDPNATLAPTAAATNDATASPPPPAAAVPSKRSDESPPDADAKRADERRASRALGLALGPSVVTGLAPDVAFGGSAELTWGERVPRGALSSFGLSLTFVRSGSHSTGGANASFDFATARPEVCSIGLALSNGLGVAPCFGAELGAVVGRGSNIDVPETSSRFWLALDASLRLRGFLSERWFLEASGGGVFPLTRYHFVFRDPDTPVHDVPVAGLVFAAKLGIRLE